MSDQALDVTQYQYDPELWRDYGLGTILRSFREAYGQTLYQVSDALKIRAVYLQYLEDGHYDGLPGYAHGLGFLKAYAEFLGLPPEEMIERYRNDTGVDQPVQVRPIDNAAPLQKLERRIPIRMAIGVVAVIGILLYCASFLFNELNFGDNRAPTLVNRISNFFFNEAVLEEQPVDLTVEQAGAAAAQGTEGAGQAESQEPAISGAATPTNAVTRAPTSGPAQTPSRILRSEDRPVLEDGNPYLPQLKPNMALLVGDQNTITVGNAQPALAGAGTGGVGAEATPIISPLAVQVPNVTAGGDQLLGGLEGFGNGPIVIGAPPTDASTTATAAGGTIPQIATRQTNAAGETSLTEPITIRAKAITWVQIRNAAGVTIRQGVLRPSQTIDAPLEPNLTLAVENFEKVDIIVSGQVVPTPQSIDPRGSVFPLDPARLRQGL